MSFVPTATVIVRLQAETWIEAVDRGTAVERDGWIRWRGSRPGRARSRSGGAALRAAELNCRERRL